MKLFSFVSIITLAFLLMLGWMPSTHHFVEATYGTSRCNAPRCFYYIFGAQVHRYIGPPENRQQCQTRCIWYRYWAHHLTTYIPPGKTEPEYKCGPCPDVVDATLYPTVSPSAIPTYSPTTPPSVIPTFQPTTAPSTVPSVTPEIRNNDDNL
jgi:hypothetical protein